MAPQYGAHDDGRGCFLAGPVVDGRTIVAPVLPASRSRTTLCTDPRMLAEQLQAVAREEREGSDKCLRIPTILKQMEDAEQLDRSAKDASRTRASRVKFLFRPLAPPPPPPQPISLVCWHVEDGRASLASYAHSGLEPCAQGYLRPQSGPRGETCDSCRLPRLARTS